ncbi:MAG: hypothetical protein AAFV77_03315 [Planctomycetota bacterium]
MTAAATGRKPLGTGKPANPFAVQHVQPGAIPFVDEQGREQSAWVESLLDRALAASGGQIEGPMGSGKTTLLVHLHRCALGRGLSATRTRAPRLGGAGRGSIAFIDGANVLTRAGWVIARAWLRLRGVVPIVTTHIDLGLPKLHTRSVSPELARVIIERLEPGTSPGPAELARMLSDEPESLRGVLFEMYDRYESA